MKTVVSIPNCMFKRIRKALLPSNMKVEEVCFLFADVKSTDYEIHFMIREWHHVESAEYDFQSANHVALRDEMRPKIIKQAHDLNAALVELHSHLGEGPAQFSSSDICGFREFVPHVRWRLSNKPYAAAVFTQSDFDALVWVGDQNIPMPLTEIQIPRFFWKRCIRPSGLTLKIRRHHDIRSIR